MKKELSKKEKVQIGLFALSVAFMIVGVLFLVNAMQEDPSKGFFKAFCAINNVLAKYIVVLLFMSCGIMLFSNVALTLENKKLRNGITIGITTFAFVLTLPLVYVLIALIPYYANLPLDPIGKVMGVDRIFAGFYAWFGSSEGLLIFMLAVLFIFGIICLLVPLLSGVFAVKGKSIKLGKLDNGKFGIGLTTLPVIAKAQAIACDCEECNSTTCGDNE